MKHLSIDEIKVSKLPPLAEIRNNVWHPVVKGALNIMVQVVLETGWTEYCSMTIQCGQGSSIPGVCPG